jgi:hypothetical protein
MYPYLAQQLKKKKRGLLYNVLSAIAIWYHHWRPKAMKLSCLGLELPEP